MLGGDEDGAVEERQFATVLRMRSADVQTALARSQMLARRLRSSEFKGGRDQEAVGSVELAFRLSCWLFEGLARGDKLVTLATWGLHLVRLDRTKLGSRVLTFAEKLRTALAEVQRGHLVRGALATIPIWLLVFSFFAVLARGLGMDALSFPAAVFGASLAILSTLLPVNGFAGFGVMDAGWVGGFTALGVSAELATSSGLAAHLVYLGNMCMFGLLAHAAMAAARR